MTVLRAFSIVIGSAVGFAAAGGMIGALLGMWVPGYSRAVLEHAQDPDISLVELGIGLGLTQGLVGGIVIGLIIVLAVTLAPIIRQKQSSP